MELEKHITDEKTGISYTLCGDYYLPDLALPEEKYYELGRFGRAKFRYLQKCHKVLLTSLRTSGTLNEYLHSVDEDCEEMFSRLVKQYAEREGVTEQMKADEILDDDSGRDMARRAGILIAAGNAAQADDLGQPGLMLGLW